MKSEKVVIVGAGVGGLTAAAYLSREKNYDVLILEKNDKTGGLVNTLEHEDFSFDTGPRAFINSGMLKPILRDLGIVWETIENKISIAIEDQIFTVESIDSLDQYKEILLNLYPEEAKDIETIIKIIYKLSQDTETLYAYDNPYFVDYMSNKKFVVTKLLPWTFKLLFTLIKFKRYSMPMEEYLADKTNNQSLIDILTQCFFKETPTSFALGYFHVWLDYFYPKGGTGLLPKLLHEKVLKDGGKFKLNTRIIEIIPSEKKLIDSEGHQYEYDHLIWAADLKTLYKEINSVGLTDKIINKIEVKK